MTELSKLLRYKKNLPRHLFEMSHLSRRSVQQEDLLSIEATEIIRENAKTLRAPFKKFEVNFSELGNERFTSFIKKLHSMNPNQIYIWTILANDCGLLRISSILEFNFNFDYSAISEGIITLLSSNIADKMTLDFFEDSMKQTKLEIELTGENWTAACY